ncbi:MAG: hypothetical protein ACK48M_04090, partial [Planctomycetia bacterium]
MPRFAGGRFLFVTALLAAPLAFGCGRRPEVTAEPALETARPESTAGKTRHRALREKVFGRKRCYGVRRAAVNPGSDGRASRASWRD